MTRTPSATLTAQLRQGGEIASADLDKAVMVQTSAELGIALFVADCDRARSRSAVFRAVARAVDFPEFFGGDFDALYDCLCDTVLDQKVGVALWFYKLHSGDPVLEEDAVRIASVCTDVSTFADKNDRTFSFVIEHAGRHPDPVPGEVAPPYGEP